MDFKDFLSGLAEIVEDEVLAKSIAEAMSVSEIQALPPELQESESLKQLKKILKVCHEQGIHNAEFSMSLMRGFDYYTDIVFEVFDTSPENNRSMFGGGRYDGLVAEFGVDSIPTVGFGMGDVTFMNFLEIHDLLQVPKSTTDAIVLVKDTEVVEEARIVAQELRSLGLRVAVDFSYRKFDKQFKAAQKSGVKFAVFIDASSISGQKFILKDLVSNKEQLHSLERIASLLKDQR